MSWSQKNLNYYIMLHQPVIFDQRQWMKENRAKRCLILMFVCVFCHPPDLEGYLVWELRYCVFPKSNCLSCVFPQNPSGHQVCVCSPNPAGQQVRVHQIHLILKTVFSHIKPFQRVFICGAKWGKKGREKMHVIWCVCDVFMSRISPYWCKMRTIIKNAQFLNCIWNIVWLLIAIEFQKLNICFLTTYNCVLCANN